MPDAGLPVSSFPWGAPPVWDPNNNPHTPHSKVIGEFEADGDGLKGVIKTLALQAPVSILPIDKVAEDAPDYAVTSENTALGWARKRVVDGGAYLDVEIDDPSFPAPIRAVLLNSVDGDKSFLVWSRR